MKIPRPDTTSKEFFRAILPDDPRVAEGLRAAAEDRRTTMEAIASLVVHSWLRQQGYF